MPVKPEIRKYRRDIFRIIRPGEYIRGGGLGGICRPKNNPSAQKIYSAGIFNCGRNGAVIWPVRLGGLSAFWRFAIFADRVGAL
jgi:hypothetical protein